MAVFIGDIGRDRSRWRGVRPWHGVRRGGTSWRKV